MDLVTLLFFPPVSLLTQLPSPAVHHPSDMNLILNLFIFLHLSLFSFLFLFLSHSLLSCFSEGHPTEQPVIKRTSHSGGRNRRLIIKPKTCLPLCVTFVISFLILLRDLERCYCNTESCFSTPVMVPLFPYLFYLGLFSLHNSASARKREKRIERGSERERAGAEKDKRKRETRER